MKVPGFLAPILVGVLAFTGVAVVSTDALAGPKRNEMVWICTNERIPGSSTKYRKVSAKIFKNREYENAGRLFLAGATLGKCAKDL